MVFMNECNPLSKHIYGWTRIFQPHCYWIQFISKLSWWYYWLKSFDIFVHIISSFEGNMPELLMLYVWNHLVNCTQFCVRSTNCAMTISNCIRSVVDSIADDSEICSWFTKINVVNLDQSSSTFWCSEM